MIFIWIFLRQSSTIMRYTGYMWEQRRNKTLDIYNIKDTGCDWIIGYRGSPKMRIIDIDLTFSSIFLKNETLGHPIFGKKTPLQLDISWHLGFHCYNPRSFGYIEGTHCDCLMVNSKLCGAIVQSQGFYRIFHHFPRFCCLTPYFCRMDT